EDGMDRQCSGGVSGGQVALGRRDRAPLQRPVLSATRRDAVGGGVRGGRSPWGGHVRAMRLLTGVAIDGRVVEMALPSDIPVAHLMLDLLAALGTEAGRLKLRRVDGTWLDLERSLGDQGCATGGVVCLEAPEVQSHGRHHDPVAELVERGPPVELIADAAVPAVIGAAAAVGLLALTDRSAPVVVALAPCAWALLPWLAGSSIALRRVSTLMATLSLMVSAAALAAAGPVAAHRPLG